MNQNLVMMKATNMIKANELRINNLVLNDKVENTVQKLSSYDALTIKNKRGDYIRATYDAIEPIPLTEEWLLRFGFIEDEKIESVTAAYNGKTYRCFGMDIINDEQYGFCQWIYIAGDSFHSTATGQQMLYVHQLQNRYFSVVQEELALTPKTNEV